ncbi:MAG: hypothetical protein V3R93_06505, partial [Candidatus Hydrothermarchaeaceae archaeon]
SETNITENLTEDNLTVIDLKNESMLRIELMPNANGTMNLTVKSSTNSSLLNVTDLTSANQKSLNRFTSINVSGIANNASGIKWVILKLYYENSDLSGIDVNTLKMYWYNESSGSWVGLSPGLNLTPSGGPFVNNTGTNQTGKYVWANLSHFSIYGVAGNIISNPPPGNGGGGCSHRLAIEELQVLDATVGGTAVLSVAIGNTGCSEKEILVWVSSLPSGWSAENKTLDIPFGSVTVNLTLRIPASEEPGRRSITVELTPKYFVGAVRKELMVGVRSAAETPDMTTTTVRTTTTTAPPTTTPAPTTTVPPETTAPPPKGIPPVVGKVIIALAAIGIIAGGAYFYRYNKRKKVEWWDDMAESKEQLISDEGKK